MSSRKSGFSQEVSSAKAGISERSGRAIEKGARKSSPTKRAWKTRSDPFENVWESELVPMLENSPGLSPITLLEYVQSKYEGEYPDKYLRTLQRRVKSWSALHGPEKEVMFRQEHQPGRMGLSDFTHLKDVIITIQCEPLKHLLYHFRLAYSGWSYMKIILGGESFTALAEGLQEALWRLGGSPSEHRTDSLSAAFKNLTRDQKEDLTKRYEEFCKHYNMEPTRNNLGVKHENGSVESPHGHLKRRIKQALMLRGSNDFDSIESYQTWLDDVVRRHNLRNAKQISVEREYLTPLPPLKTTDFIEVVTRVSTSSTIDIRKVTYTVPSRLQGEILRVHLYQDRLCCYVGSTEAVTLSRIYPLHKTERARNIDYRHIIHSLVRKPQAFRFSQIRNDILPNDKYRCIWRHVEKNIRGKEACKFIVGILYLAAEEDCEVALGDYVLALIDRGKPFSLIAIQNRFKSSNSKQTHPDITVTQHALNSYDSLLISQGEQ